MSGADEMEPQRRIPVQYEMPTWLFNICPRFALVLIRITSPQQNTDTHLDIQE
jgi:hypothetical protein